jgi:cytoskeletal protein RodZ
VSETEPPEPPEPPEPAEFSEFFHTEDLPERSSRPASHRGTQPSPFLGRLLAPVTAVVVVVVVILLLIWINGSPSGNNQSPAAVGPGTPPPTHAASASPSPSPSSIPSTTSPKPPSLQPTSAVNAPPSTPTKKAKPAVPTAMAPVAVLNNSRTQGLAHSVAAEVQAKGWHISAVGNLQGLVPLTTVYYAPGDAGAAKHLAHEFSAIRRIEPNSAGHVHGSALTLVVTSGWTQ